MRRIIAGAIMAGVALAGCTKSGADVPPERAASNADFKDWVGKLPDKLKAPAPDRKSRIRGVFQGCLMATTADSVLTCRCNVRAMTKTYPEAELGLALDKAWVDIARPWKLAEPAEIAKVQARIGTATLDPAKVSAVLDIQTQCGSPESLKDQ